MTYNCPKCSFTVWLEDDINQLDFIKKREGKVCWHCPKCKSFIEDDKVVE